MKELKIFDSTLRDGAQAKGISFSIDDKLKLVKILDNLGIKYIESGNPGSNPKDIEFFERIKDIKLSNAKLTAFGSTRRKNIEIENDSNVMALLSANTPAVAIFGKSWDLHVTQVIKTTLEENLNMIRDTIEFFKKNGKEVIFDAEHFIDGYKANSDYAMKTIEAALEGGADCIVLCDTNGGAFPDEIADIVDDVKKITDVELGIHCHDDGGMAVANSIIAVEKGITQVQGTFLGYGERCGNANLCSLIGNLQLKKGYKCIKESEIENLTSVARYIAEISNIKLDSSAPYVGVNAFSHKGGMHIDGVNKVKESFEHIDPSVVGNERSFLMSEVAGRSTILNKIRRVCPTIEKDSEDAKLLIDELKRLEHEGYQFEGAESSFELRIIKHFKSFKPFFHLDHFKVIADQHSAVSNYSATAVVKVNVDGINQIMAAEGDGPVNALDKALRKALEIFYPSLTKVHLTDFKVRVLDAKAATAAKVRVLIESTDGKDYWTTVGVSTDIIEASWRALIDSIEYKLYKDKESERM